MRRLGISTVFFCVFISLAIAGCSLMGISRGPKKYDLKYKLKEGFKFSLTLSGQNHYVREVMGNELAVDTKGTAEYGFEVLSTTKEGSTLEVDYGNRIHETDDPESQGGVDFSELMGKKTKIDFSLRGELSNFAGFENLPTIEIPDQEASLGEEQYINEIRRIFPKLPDNPISVGETWSHIQKTDESTQGGTVTITSDYIYTLLEETEKNGIDCLKIDAKYTVSVEGKLASRGIEFTMKLGGEGNELLYFAHKKNMLLFSEDNLVLEGSANNEALGISVSMKHDYKTITDVTLD
jgi:hypothetical protein